MSTLGFCRLFEGCSLKIEKTPSSHIIRSLGDEYLTIIPRARMGSESLDHEAEGQWAIDSEAMRARGIIVSVKSN